jgi:hypothetical protein
LKINKLHHSLRSNIQILNTFTKRNKTNKKSFNTTFLTSNHPQSGKLRFILENSTILIRNNLKINKLHYSLRSNIQIVNTFTKTNKTKKSFNTTFLTSNHPQNGNLKFILENSTTLILENST